MKRSSPRPVLAGALLLALWSCSSATDDDPRGGSGQVQPAESAEQAAPGADEPTDPVQPGEPTTPEGEASDSPDPEDPVPQDETVAGPIGTLSRSGRQSDDYPRWGGETVQLVDARLIELPGIDRLVLEFDGPVPSWRIRPVTGPIRERPGRHEIELAGDAHLEVGLVPAASIDRDAAEPTAAYRGPSVLDSAAPGLLEAALTGDRSDQLTWVLGTAGEPDVAVGELEDPSRVVIDVPAG